MSNRGQSCVDPEHRTSECVAPRDQVAILVPVAQQATGTFELDASSWFVTTAGKPFAGSCVGGNGASRV